MIYKKHIKIVQIFGALLALGAIGAGFFQVNTHNYKKHLQIRDNYIQHPENLANSDLATITSFGFQNLRADWYWLSAIQYIGGNAIGSEYKKYLYSMLNLITDLNPYFEKPYIIGLLLLPSSNDRYESFSENQILANIAQGEQIGLKGIKNFCDADKIELIANQNDLLKIWSEEKYKDPCKSYDIPYSLAYVYWHYLKDPLAASTYYKVASANSDSIEGAKVMAAIMQGKGGEREKSFFMFLGLSKYIAGDDPICLGFAQQFEQLGAAVFQNRLTLTGQIISDIQTAREQTLGVFNDGENDLQTDDTQCVSYINKAVREINLYYIEQADSKYQAENKGESAKHAQQLFDEKYIDFLPTDFQQYEDYGVIYEYNSDTDKYDYDTGTYK